MIYLTTIKVIDAFKSDKHIVAIPDEPTAKKIEDLASWEH